MTSRTVLAWGLLLGLAATPAAAVHLNEVRVWQPDTTSMGGPDDRSNRDAYVEFAGEPGEDLAGIRFHTVSGGGVVQTSLALPAVLPADGIYAFGIFDAFAFEQPTQWCTGYDDLIQAPMSFPGGLILYASSDQTLLLVSGGWLGEFGTDLDVDDDGVLEQPPGVTILDSVGLRAQGTGHLYSAHTIAAHAGDLVARVVDVRGRVVRTLAAGEEFGAGRQELTWNGRDDAGRPLPSGVYFYKIQAGDAEATGRLALIK